MLVGRITPNKLKWGKIEMNIINLCKAAERYELLCMMNLSDDEIACAAEHYEIHFDVLCVFIDKGARDTKKRGNIFAHYVEINPQFVETVLLTPNFYEIWGQAVND